MPSTAPPHIASARWRRPTFAPRHGTLLPAGCRRNSFLVSPLSFRVVRETHTNPESRSITSGFRVHVAARRPGMTMVYLSSLGRYLVERHVLVHPDIAGQ